ncbi:unknown [Bacteroides sp. CAG:702]|nr:unknown [Bacteroides sp. CAG:702]
MYPFSCVLWAIFLVLSPLFFGQIARYLPITEAKMPQKLIPNQRTINSKQLLIYTEKMHKSIPRKV